MRLNPLVLRKEIEEGLEKIFSSGKKNYHGIEMEEAGKATVGVGLMPRSWQDRLLERLSGLRFFGWKGKESKIFEKPGSFG